MASKRKPGERAWGQSNLAFEVSGTKHEIYLLEKGENFDPRTSTKGRHILYGPTMVVIETSTMGHRVSEHYVSDEKIWSWIRRIIREGHLNSETIREPKG